MEARSDDDVTMIILFLEGDMSRKGGTERMTAVLANALCESNNVWVLSLQQREKSVFFKLDRRVQYEHLDPRGGRLDLLKQIAEVRQFIHKNHIDVVINVDIGTSIYGIPAAWGTKAKVITWEPGNYYNNWGSRWFPYFRRFAAKHSAALVVLTEKDKQNYEANPRSKKPIYVIPNPIDRHDYHYDSASKTILSAGLLLPIKGFDQAIQAAAKVLSKHPDWKWIICGEGPEREKLESLICDAHLENQLLLPGTVTDMEKQYQKAALYVMTSQMEGLPMVLLEAKSWGLPIVSYDIMTGPSDIVRDGVNGYLVEPNNVDALTKRLTELMDDSTLREEFSAQSQLDMERFDIAHIVKQWESVLGYEEKNPIPFGSL